MSHFLSNVLYYLESLSRQIYHKVVVLHHKESNFIENYNYVCHNIYIDVFWILVHFLSCSVNVVQDYTDYYFSYFDIFFDVLCFVSYFLHFFVIYVSYYVYDTIRSVFFETFFGLYFNYVYYSVVIFVWIYVIFYKNDLHVYIYFSVYESIFFNFDHFFLITSRVSLRNDFTYLSESVSRHVSVQDYTHVLVSHQGCFVCHYYNIYL